MRRLLAWVAGAAGAWTLVRLLGDRRRRPPVDAPPPGPDPRAEALRAKLAEARGVVDEQDAFASGEVAVDEAEAPPAAPDDRRRRVHAEGRAAAERMRRSPST